jgi:hypothetical protein
MLSPELLDEIGPEADFEVFVHRGEWFVRHAMREFPARSKRRR